MEHVPQATGSQSGDHFVDMELQPVGNQDAQRQPVEEGSHPTGDGSDYHIAKLNHPVEAVGATEKPECHVVDIISAAGDNVQKCCVVCTGPLEWVAIGRCGHRVVCPKCMMRSRFFYRDNCCCICRTYCSRVVVTKTNAEAAIMSTLPLFAFWEGRVGKYWYHRYTRAYFEDKEVYKATTEACRGIESPFYKPVFIFIMWFFGAIVIGAFIGVGFADHTNNRSTQVRAYALCVTIAILIAAIWWALISNCPVDRLDEESYLRARQRN
ncbi:hypothetical protein EJB05_11101 [Eragrostis curvula]|uniref:Uncharacterized protein n=1 Tax=Eragrostis curvula TaxID=38414 RepID=A0A5J9SU07_9POAL|nr:hypothetical protein EJB05_52057 [Eragrostis curvula]TVU37766.1 hypothetical protein EJB05_11101 [Eragrostis curvula]